MPAPTPEGVPIPACLRRAEEAREPATAGFSWNERHLQCIWADARLRPARLVTTGGRPVRVLDPGRWNGGPGPDFRGAKLEIGGELRRGDVEVHVRPGDWNAHGHSGDPAYADVALHVAWFPPAPGEALPDEGRFKMNPPIRTAADRDALLEAVADGTVDMIATDHAPHSAEEKSRGFKGSLNGILGLESAFPVMYTQLVEGGVIDVARLITLMSTAPAQRFGLPGGRIEAGAAADLAVVDLEEQFRIDPSGWKSKGRSTPFEGMDVSGRIMLTMTEGKIVYER